MVNQGISYFFVYICINSRLTISEKGNVKMRGYLTASL